MSPDRIAVVDGQPIVCRGLRELIAGEPDLELVGEAPNRPEALRWLGALEPDLVLVDLSLGTLVEGLAIVRELHAARPDLAILVMSGASRRRDGQRAGRSPGALPARVKPAPARSLEPGS